MGRVAVALVEHGAGRRDREPRSHDRPAHLAGLLVADDSGGQADAGALVFDSPSLTSSMFFFEFELPCMVVPSRRVVKQHLYCPEIPWPIKEFPSTKSGSVVVCVVVFCSPFS